MLLSRRYAYGRNHARVFRALLWENAFIPWIYRPHTVGTSKVSLPTELREASWFFSIDMHGKYLTYCVLKFNKF